jgi:hypothetical protein
MTRHTHAGSPPVNLQEPASGRPGGPARPRVRFTVSALGSASDKPVPVVVGQVAATSSPTPSPGYAVKRSLRQRGGQERPGSAAPKPDRGDTPGRRLGHGSRELGLTGTVDLDEFTSVLAGRDPRTGERLITARGSAGRVALLGAGTAARWTAQGAVGGPGRRQGARVV